MTCSPTLDRPEPELPGAEHPPAEAEKRYYAMLEEPAMAA
jgi:hypothetical protein